MRENRKKVIFELPLELHTEVKVAAAKRNISMSLWIHRAILDKIKKEA
jgi:predicted HicB family RNase H-like nuclease